MPGDRRGPSTMSFDQFNPAWVVLLIFAAAFLAPVLARVPQKNVGWLLAVLPALAFAFFAVGGVSVWQEETWRSSIEWAPAVGVNWDVWVTPLGLFLALLVTGIGALITIFAGAYFGDSPHRGRFFLNLYLFMGAMLGLAVTENLIVFFVFWELTSISSYLLIGFNHSKTEARKSALDALLVTGGGGLVLLAGILLLGQVGGSFLLGELIENRDAVHAHPLYAAILICFIVGAVTKSAQFPFHFWLPGAMAAPAPVSAYLHSATMVKAGVFLLALLHPLLGDTPLWHYTLLAIGAITMTLGALIAVLQTDLKRLLAYTTVSALGTLVMLLGFEDDLAAKAAVIFFIVHALYKGALFMIAGILEKTTGTRDVSQLHGLMKSMPVLGIAAVFAAASMSGIPPFIGFISKELLYQVKLEAPITGWSLLVCGIVANAANIVVALKVGVAPFLQSRGEDMTLKSKPSIGLVIGPVVLGLGSLIFGIFPQLILGDAVTALVNQIKVADVTIKLKLWHGLNLVLLLSVVTVALGFVGFAFRKRFWALGREITKRASHFEATRIFRGLLQAVIQFAGLVTRTIQSGNLRQYAICVLTAFLALLVWAFVRLPIDMQIPDLGNLRFDVILVFGLIAVGSVCMLLTRKRLTAVLFLGSVGFGIAALFALYGAPDLAITQLLVETLTLVLFALAIYNLPSLPSAVETKRPRIVSLVISLAFGAGITVLTLKAMSMQLEEPVAVEIAQRSVSEAYGRNVVNVILVDFRSLDTLGEIAVLAIAALGVAGMLRSACSSVQVSSRAPSSAVLLASARFTAPAMIAFSIYLLLRGHNEPGGGFIGGLVGAMAVVLIHLARPDLPLRFLKLSPRGLVAIGLGLAVVSGLPGLLGEGSFAAAAWGPAFDLPLIGKLKLGTPLIFDVGVYALVLGIVLLLYDTMQMWNASSRSQPQPIP
ncbi:MAG: hydrogen gas-evolving membrane-bound hydrogenase subunit E [Verrucomicrobiota bacterium]